MPDISIDYKGSSIGTISESGTKTIKTAQKYCEDDIEIVYERPEPHLVNISITENGTYSHEGCDGYDEVVVDVEGTEPVISAITFTENGIYSVPTGIDGFGPVTVDVNGGAEGDALDDFLCGKMTSFVWAGCVSNFSGMSQLVQNPLNTINITTSGVNYSLTEGAFRYHHALNSVTMYNVTRLNDGYCFSGCTNLEYVNFPNLTSIDGNNHFASCWNLREVNMPNCSYFGNYTFSDCFNLSTLSLPNAYTLGARAFRNCSRFISLYLMGSSMCSLENQAAFECTPFSDSTSYTAGRYGSIYVPASLYSNYIAATNWAVYSNRFVSVEEA